MKEKIKNIVNILESNSDKYYNGEDCISDEEFDNLKKLLKSLDPENPFLNKVGGKFKHGVEIKHIYPMLSIEDVKNPQDAEDWINSLYDKFASHCDYDERIVYIECKIDGTSGSLHYDKDGNLKYGVTRGDGHTGNKILFLKEFGKKIDKMGTIPTKIHKEYIDFGNEDFEIRGEFVILSEFENLDLFKEKSLRNICSGALNRLEYSEVFDYIAFIPYQIYTKSKGLITYGENEMDKKFWEMNKKYQFFVLDSYRELIHVSEINKFYLDYLVNRCDYGYDTDGLVLTFPDNSLFKKIDSNYVIKSNHKYNLALKPIAKTAISIIKSIKWNVGRTGRLIPVAELEPVKIDKVTITNVTLNNVAFVEKEKLHKGCVIKIERANDVIPHYLNLIEDTSPNENLDIPKTCPICNSKLDKVGLDLVCKNSECEGKVVSSIVHWLRDIHNTEGIAEATVNKICKGARPKIKDVVDFYDFILLDKFGDIINGEVEQDNIYNAVKNSLNEITEISLMEGLGLPGIKKAKLFRMGIYNVKNLKNFKFKAGMGEDEKKLNEWIKDSYNLKKLDKYYNYFQKYLKDRIVNNKNWKICVTGKFDISRKELIKKIESKGCTYVNTVTPNTKYLLNDDNELRSSKAKAAEKYKVRIISSKEFFDNFNKT